MINLTKYDFFDFGSGFGGCIDFAKKKLGGINGLGFERHNGRCNDLVKLGYKCINKDITKLSLPKKCVNFTTISHVLEHLNNIDEVNYVIQLAIRASRNFVFIEGPSFDFDDYLEKLGFKFMWRDGHGHLTKVKVNDIIKCIKDLNILDFTILTERPHITDSSSFDIHPLNSQINLGKYNHKKHPTKKLVQFDRNIYRSFIIFIWLNNKFNRDKLLVARSKFTVDNNFTF